MCQSGFYLIDTELDDGEIESFIKGTGLCRYVKERLIPTTKGNTFEMLVVGLSHECDDNGIIELRERLMMAEERMRDAITYSLAIKTMMHICLGEKTVVHVYGRIDLTSLNSEDLDKFDSALSHNNGTILVICKQKPTVTPQGDSIINIKSLKEPDRYRLMENRLDKVHISYKHDDAYESALNAITAGLEKNGIPYSIDKYDILYRGSIDDYEKEIGVSDRVIMFVIPNYLKSLDCMFEMTEMFNKGRVRERIYPVVDMGEIPRNGDGLTLIKDYWQNEKARKANRIPKEPGGSSYLLMEIKRIDDIINTLDDLWFFICRDFTGNYEKLIENEAALLMEELKQTLPKVIAPIEDKFVPTDDTMPTAKKIVNQNGKQSVYIENITGNITINKE